MFDLFQTIVINKKLGIPRDILNTIGYYYIKYIHNPFNIDIDQNCISSNGKLIYKNNNLILTHENKEYILNIPENILYYNNNNLILTYKNKGYVLDIPENILYYKNIINYFDCNNEYIVINQYIKNSKFIIYKINDLINNNYNYEIIDLINVGHRIPFYIDQHKLEIYYIYNSIIDRKNDDTIFKYNIKTKIHSNDILNIKNFIIMDCYIIKNFKFVYMVNIDTFRDILIICKNNKVIKIKHIIFLDSNYEPKFYYKNNIVYFYNHYKNLKLQFDLNDLDELLPLKDLSYLYN